MIALTVALLLGMTDARFVRRPGSVSHDTRSPRPATERRRGLVFLKDEG